MPFYLAHSHMSSFSHLWDYEPAPNNHWMPNYGLFANLYFNYSMKQNNKSTTKFTAMDKNPGPPHYHYSASYDPLDKNEYLLSKGVDIAALKARNKNHSLIEA